MVDKSNINKQLEVYTAGGNPDTVAGEFGRHPLYKMMGYFSLVGLLRLHCLLGDFHQAIKVLENVELNKKSLYSRVPGCQITMYYYVGFAYMMMKRYADAIRTFCNILLYIQRTRGLFQVTAEFCTPLDSFVPLEDMFVATPLVGKQSRVNIRFCSKEKFCKDFLLGGLYAAPHLFSDYNFPDLNFPG